MKIRYSTDILNHRFNKNLQVVTYDVQTSLATIQCTSFSCNTTSVAIVNQNLYCIEKDKIFARTLQGTLRQEISLPEIEGDPEILEVNRCWMAVATTNGFIRIYNLSAKYKNLLEAIDLLILNFQRCPTRTQFEIHYRKCEEFL